jgi:hypothetical protein
MTNTLTALLFLAVYVALCIWTYQRDKPKPVAPEPEPVAPEPKPEREKPPRRRHRMSPSRYDELLSYRGRAYRVQVLQADKVKRKVMN